MVMFIMSGVNDSGVRTGSYQLDIGYAVGLGLYTLMQCVMK